MHAPKDQHLKRRSILLSAPILSTYLAAAAGCQQESCDKLARQHMFLGPVSMGARIQQIGFSQGSKHTEPLVQ